ncbi:Gfo/Idh/MocA family protein [Halobacillus sp. Nhm2S1]|uniref:Gfo/Idh/MocA family protein n=1 Tax=Halobacillus sp. Nhm2S1 TaxID=2866716 RepID=UPI001C737025|nr:Gfo/Idh/MocA family oxidoreductase [Halobacillus sp. Nhm2S1]MBX0359318.1 Gfo/Idh/MocA family oxidoreductase [Halobacillus sp. Nhm2S1]
MIRVALLSKWHVHAVDYAREASENPAIHISKVWDEDIERGKMWAEELGVPFDDDLKQVLSDPEIDGVILTSPTNLHKEIIMAAAHHGKHIYTEKVLSLSRTDDKEIFSSIEGAGVNFMISLPRLTSDYYLYAQKVVDEGVLGTVNMIRCRVAHNGAVPNDDHPNGWLPERFFDKDQCGGGTLIDLGAHPIYLANRLAGKPKAVSARLHSLTGRGVDDHSVATVEYDSGILAVLESSFVSSGSPFQLEIYGTDGTLMVEGSKVRIKSRTHGMNEWTCPELPAPIHSPLQQWVDDILNQEEPTIKKEDALQLTAVNEAAALSHKQNMRITIE